MYYNVKGKVFLKGEIVLVIRAKRTSEHLALALFAGILLYFAHSFLVNEVFIPNEVLRSIASAALSVLQLGVPALMFYAMQKRAGFEEPKLKKNREGSAKYNVTLAFGGFSAIFVFGLLYSAAFPMAAPAIKVTGTLSFAINAASSVIIPAVFEEYLYRRLICRELTIHGGAFAVIISALLFGLAHFSFYTFPYAFICGLILGFVYLKTGSAKYTAAIHIANNLFAYVLAIIGTKISALDYTNFVMLLAIALSVMALGAFYTVIPNMNKFALCENGNVASSAFLTFSMVVYLVCAVLMNFI